MVPEISRFSARAEPTRMAMYEHDAEGRAPWRRDALGVARTTYWYVAEGGRAADPPRPEDSDPDEPFIVDG
ncbi:MAG TPA: hypothetical protein VKD90_25085 [Gemmataceae bacterium]|nr:hypothetical protein [Gemmataceae bacterium]